MSIFNNISKGVLIIKKWFHNTKEFMEFLKVYIEDKNKDHNKWPDKYKDYFKWGLIFTEFNSFLTIFYITSGSIISEKITGVNLFGFKMVLAILFLLISSYFTQSIYKDKKELRFAYITGIIAILIAKTGFLLV